jgi:hypothetical protein
VEYPIQLRTVAQSDPVLGLFSTALTCGNAGVQDFLQKNCGKCAYDHPIVGIQPLWPI